MITVGAAGPVCEPGDGGPTVRQPGGRAELLCHHPQEDHPGMFYHVPDSVRIRIQMGECIRIQAGQSLSPPLPPSPKGSNEGISLLKSSLLTGAFL